MTRCNDIELWPFDGRQVTAEEWQHFKRCAQEANIQARRELLLGVLCLLRSGVASTWHAIRAGGRSIAARVRKGWHAYLAARERTRAIRELRALDDRMLKDIGLGRSEIESVIFDVERLADRRRPLVARGRECVVRTQNSVHDSVRRQEALKPANGPQIDRTAA